MDRNPDPSARRRQAPVVLMGGLVWGRRRGSPPSGRSSGSRGQGRGPLRGWAAFETRPCFLRESSAERLQRYREAGGRDHIRRYVEPTVKRFDHEMRVPQSSRCGRGRTPARAVCGNHPGNPPVRGTSARRAPISCHVFVRGCPHPAAVTCSGVCRGIAPIARGALSRFTSGAPDHTTAHARFPGPR